MNKHTRQTAILFWLFSLTAPAQVPTDYYVINRANIKIYGADISADENGTVLLQLQNGGTQRFRRGTYLSVHCPKPAELAQAENLIRTQQLDAALILLETALAKYRYLGWGDLILLRKARILIKMQNFDQALESLKLGLKTSTNANTKRKFRVVMIDALIGKKRYEEAESMLYSMDLSDPESAPLVYNQLGRLLINQDKKREAILQYLKTILLYPDSGKIRKVAYRQVVRLLRDLGDNRHADFSRRMKKEFP